MLIVKKLALFFHRSIEEGQTTARHLRDQRNSRLFLLGLTLLIGAFVFIVSKQFSQWNHSQPELIFPRKNWHFVYQDSSSPCDLPKQSQSTCLYNPNNQALWYSPWTYSSSDYVARMEIQDGRPFWIGFTIGPNDLERAFRIRANQLTLGIIKGSYTVWVDGVLYLQNLQSDLDPILLTLPMAKLAQTEPLRIAIRVQPDKSITSPEILFSSVAEGLSTKANSIHSRNLSFFWSKAQPMIFFLANLFFSIFFFGFWFYAQEKQEYFYVAIYALANALFQVHKVDILNGFFSPHLDSSIDIFFLYLEGAFGMVIGLAFARTKKRILQLSVLMSLIVSLALAFSFPVDSTQFQISAYLSYWSGTIGCALGAAVCFLQSFYLSTMDRENTSFRSRIRRLLLFGVGLLLAAVFYKSTHTPLPDLVHTVVWSKLGQLMLVFYLIAVAVFDVREQKLLFEKTPISRYHRRHILPKKLTGSILVVDLKNSEILLRLGAKTGDSGKWVQACLSYMWTAVIHQGGVLLMTEGDQLRAFFDIDHCPNPTLNALKATDEMVQNFSILEKQLEEHTYDGLNIPKITFRGSIAAGEIRPVWQEMEESRFASWVEAGSTHPFLESSRMMELERQYVRGQNAQISQVVVSEEVAVQLEGEKKDLQGSWTLRSQSIIGKHGKEYTVAIYAPGSPPVFFESSLEQRVS